MSTQDKAGDNNGRDQASGVNAYKVNRGGLVPPAPASAPRAAADTADDSAGGIAAVAQPFTEARKASKRRVAAGAAGFATLLAVA